MEKNYQLTRQAAQGHDLELPFDNSTCAGRIPTRVLMTTDCVGGVWNYSLDLAEALAGYGVRVALATMGPSPSQSQRSEAARISNLELFESNYKLEWMDSPWAEVDAASIWLTALARDFNPDIAHLNGYSHASLDWNAPVVVVAHSCVRSWWAAVKTESIPDTFAEYRSRVSMALPSANLVVAPTRAMLEAIEQNYDLPGPRKVIPNGRFRSIHAPGKKMDLILTAGRLWDEAKGLQFLEGLAPELDWPVYAAGQPRHPSGSLESFHYIHALGHLDHHRLAEEMSAASIYAAPALYEPFGLTVLEAALSGCALVLSDIPSFRENWTDAALLVSTKDRSQWCAALNRLSNDRPFRESLARRALNRAAALEPEKIGTRYYNAYCEVLDHQATGHRGSFAR